jgi:hypothetical protein
MSTSETTHLSLAQPSSLTLCETLLACRLSRGRPRLTKTPHYTLDPDTMAHVASTLPSHRSRRGESSCRSSQSVESGFPTLDSTRIRTSPPAASRRKSLVGTVVRYRDAYTPQLCVGIFDNDHVRCPVQQDPPSLLDQQLTCFPEQSFKERSFALPEIASPLAEQSQRTHARLRTKVEIRNPFCGPQNN